MNDIHFRKQFRIICILFVFIFFAAGRITAQMSFNGATGLYTIPNARVGWEAPNRFGLDLGYHAILTGDSSSHIPKMSVSLFNLIEVHGAFDIQGNSGNDLIAGAKLQLPLGNTAIALGGNYQRLNLMENGYNAGQGYIAISYPGRIFNSPAETTVVLGMTFGETIAFNSNIDFGIGFSLALLPTYLSGLVSWVTDFSNFSYSVEPFAVNSSHRGVMNSGLRFDFSVIPAFRRIKFSVDLFITDALDSNRAFSVGAVLGVPFL